MCLLARASVPNAYEMRSVCCLTQSHFAQRRTKRNKMDGGNNSLLCVCVCVCSCSTQQENHSAPHTNSADLCTINWTCTLLHLGRRSGNPMLILDPVNISAFDPKCGLAIRPPLMVGAHATCLTSIDRESFDLFSLSPYSKTHFKINTPGLVLITKYVFRKVKNPPPPSGID